MKDSYMKKKDKRVVETEFKKYARGESDKIDRIGIMDNDESEGV